MGSLRKEIRSRPNAQGIRVALVSQLIKIAIVSLILGAILLTFLNLYIAQSVRSTAIEGRIEGYHEVLINSFHQYDDFTILQVSELLQADEGIRAAKLTNRFNKVVFEFGFDNPDWYARDVLERKIPDDLNADFVAATAIYVINPRGYLAEALLKSGVSIGLFSGVLCLIIWAAYSGLNRRIVQPLRSLHVAIEERRSQARWNPSEIENPLEVRDLGRVVSESFEAARQANVKVRNSMSILTNLLRQTKVLVRSIEKGDQIRDFGKVIESPVLPIIPDKSLPTAKEMIEEINRRRKEWVDSDDRVTITEDPASPALLGLDIEIASNRSQYYSVGFFSFSYGSYSFVISDVTHQRLLELRTSKQERAEVLGRLSSGIAHDFNNILAIILSTAEIMQSEGTCDPDRISSIISACDRGGNLTRSLLSFASVSKLQEEEVELTQLIVNLLNWFRRTIPDDLEIEVVAEPNVGLVNVDMGIAENTILNLLLNARDAMGESGKITVRLYNDTVTDPLDVHDGEALSPGDYVVVSVKDTGNGIPKDQISLVFQPFFTTKPVGEGSGMGLAMASGFLRQSGGGIRILSEPGNGADVQLYFPSFSNGKAGQRESARAAAPFHSRRILLVEDEAALRWTLEQQLTRVGHHVVSASDYVEAINAYFVTEGIDVVVTDQRLPGPKDGLDLARELQKAKPDLAIIIVSGHAFNGTDDPDLIRLRKPLKFKELLAAIDQATMERH